MPFVFTKLSLLKGVREVCLIKVFIKAFENQMVRVSSSIPLFICLEPKGVLKKSASC